MPVRFDYTLPSDNTRVVSRINPAVVLSNLNKYKEPTLPKDFVLKDNNYVTITPKQKAALTKKTRKKTAKYKTNKSKSNPKNEYLDYKANLEHYDEKLEQWSDELNALRRFTEHGLIADLILSNPKFVEESAAPMDNTIVFNSTPSGDMSTEIQTPLQQLRGMGLKPKPSAIDYALMGASALPIAYMVTAGGIVPTAISMWNNPLSWLSSTAFGTFGAEGVNSGVRLFTDYNSWGDMLGTTPTEKFLFELTNPGGLLGVKGWNLGQSGDRSVRIYRLAREMNRTPFTPTNTEPVLNIGWGPKQTISVSHKSLSPEELSLYNPQRYDVVNEGANPFGIWYLGKQGVPRTVQNGASVEKAAKAERARQLFEERPFTHSGELTLNKPITTVGEVPDRSALSYTAELMGADGIIYNGVYDNGLNSNLVILSFKHPQLAAVPKFQSELDWSPESWFATRSDGKYTPEDVQILNSHIDEYLDIERKAKADGTWLQMSDGSTWQGDPRSWVLMQSQAYKDYMNGSLFPDRTFVHASPAKFGLFDYRHFGQNTDNGYYGKGFYFHPSTAYLLSINRFIHPNSYGDEIYNMAARINNPLFPKSMNDTFYNSNVHLFNREGAPAALKSFDSVLTFPPQFMFHEGLGATNPELIIKNINDVKSILGNNGNFSIFSNGFYHKKGGKLKYRFN